MTAPDRRSEELVVPRRVDAVLRDTVALLELVRQEEKVLTRLQGCVVELEAIRRARLTLAERTESEVVEAVDHLRDVPGTACFEWWRQ